MNLRIIPTKLNGTVTLPPSKSIAIRLAFCSAILRTKGLDVPMPEEIFASYAKDALADDIKSALRAATAIAGKEKSIDCGESAAVLRFGVCVAAALGLEAEFTGGPTLSKRPIEPLLRCLENHGITVSSYRLPFRISGKLVPGKYEIDSSETSQFISGLLFAKEIEPGIEIVTPNAVVSKSYIKMTEKVLENAKRGNFSCEGDWSAAAFWIGANRLGCNIKLNGLSMDSLQGDSAAESLFDKLGGEVDLSDNPDLAPILEIVSYALKKDSKFVGTERLKTKESNRLLTMNYVVYCNDKFIDPHDDHRIAMAAGIYSCVSDKDIFIKNAECVSKSYPLFWEDFKALGGKIEEV